MIAGRRRDDLGRAPSRHRGGGDRWPFKRDSDLEQCGTDPQAMAIAAAMTAALESDLRGCSLQHSVGGRVPPPPPLPHHAIATSCSCIGPRPRCTFVSLGVAPRFPFRQLCPSLPRCVSSTGADRPPPRPAGPPRDTGGVCRACIPATELVRLIRAPYWCNDGIPRESLRTGYRNTVPGVTGYARRLDGWERRWIT